MCIITIHQSSFRSRASYEETQSAIGCLKCCKAAGESGTLPELLMYGGPVILDKLVELFSLV